MSNILALDVGSKHTGVAIAHDGVEVPVALDTLNTQNVQELTNMIASLVATQNIETLVVGDPLLLSSASGKQAKYVEDFLGRLQSRLPASVTITTIDERLSSSTEPGIDKNAAAAIKILQVFLDQKKSL